ncbi:MAG TPA: serine hydrolase [Gemmatimonadota bacterium]|nr:serine hydrolase [Gemmatimonadota bacterium]
MILHPIPTPRSIPAILLLATIGLAAGAPAQTAPPPGLDAYVHEVMETFEVPGLALAIVKDGEVVLAEGYGVRHLGEPAPVDPHTLFGIASNTKAFTATAIGILVEEGKLSWDQPVIDVLPSFRMSDPYVTAELTVRDLLVHRSGLGLGAGDLLFWPGTTYDRDEIVHRLRYVPIENSFRATYNYDNVLYMVAGEVIEAASGMPWESFVETRILEPLGMRDTRAGLIAATPDSNIAYTHARVEGVVRVVEPDTTRSIAPAGGIMSSATDMARWLDVQLARGRLGDGDSLFSQATSRELWTLVTPLEPGPPPPELAPLEADFNGYALGFFVGDYRGRKMVRHTGGLPGFVSRVAMIPEEGVGVAVLTNQESGAAFDAIAFHVLDHYLAVDPPYDWLGGWKTLVARIDSVNAAAVSATASARDSTVGPSLPLAKYAGVYADPWYGDVAISLEDTGLVMRFSRTPIMVGDLEHWQYDTFLVRWRDRSLRADAFVTFQLDPDGSVDRVRMEPASPTVDFSYDFQDLDLEPKREE